MAPRTHARLIFTLTVIITLSVLARTTGVSAWLNREHIQSMVESAGPWGPLAFVAVFVAAVVSQVPGLLFVAVAPALFRLPEAWALSFGASNLAVVLNFALVRKLGGQPLAQLMHPRLRQVLEHLDERPVRTVAILRTITVMFPPVTSALALTSLRARHHFIGSAIGMLLPITALVFVSRFLLLP